MSKRRKPHARAVARRVKKKHKQEEKAQRALEGHSRRGARGAGEKLHMRLDQERFTAITMSATLEELRHPRSVSGSRVTRIARGSGRPSNEVRMVFKALAEAEVIPTNRSFYEMKAESLAASYAERYQERITAEMVLSAIDERFPEDPPAPWTSEEESQPTKESS